MFVATRTNKKGEIPDSETQEKIEHLDGLKGAGYSDEEAFEAIFGKKRHGRVRCYGRSIMKSSLKREKQLQQIQQQQKEEVATMARKQENLTCEVCGLRSLVKVLFKQVNPDMSEEQLQLMIEAAQQSAPDENSVPNCVRKNIPPSSGSSHIPKDVDVRGGHGMKNIIFEDFR
ncbi:hypothetical protein PIB30_084260 [Stylosanthes scabra]|uniref:Uncharacterized protein n=1 Tax=Stylosanthes scabra TaxID=79078 RepID=A0ABU6XUU8_9FABA|nr:hypothetical protein [Stylosanthes scabra]